MNLNDDSERICEDSLQASQNGIELNELLGLPSAFVGWGSLINFLVGSLEQSLLGVSRPRVDGGYSKRVPVRGLRWGRGENV